VDIDPKLASGVIVYPFYAEIYIDYNVAYITGNDDVDAKFSKDGQILLTIEVLDDNEVLWIEPAE
jgi:hypothetical protein